LFPVLKLLHEFGHAYCVKAFGGEVHEMGVMILVLTPVPYVDASAAWAFPSKWQRVLVGVAEAGLFPGLLLYFHRWFPQNHRGRVIGWFLTGLPLATAIGAPVSTAFLQMDGIWGLHGWNVPEHMWQLTAAFFAVVAAFLPRRRDVVGLAAVAAAVVIALQLGLNYWFYLYLVWFFPFVAVALFARYRIADLD